MIVTAVLAEVTPAGHGVVSRKARGHLAERLGDSKALLSHGNVGLGEAWARALVLRGAGRTGAPPNPKTVDELLLAVSADDKTYLRALCQGHAEQQCWSAGETTFQADSDLVNTLCADLDKLSQKGVQLRGVRSKIVCSKRLNDALGEGKSRFSVDLHAMEELILGFREQAGEEVFAVCGKVGGFGSYSDAFGPLNGRLHSIVEEKRSVSRYYFPQLGEIGFVMDADDSDILVSLASLVGKYVREILMGKIAAYYNGAGLNVPDASGYHDPVTAAFVDQTALLRKKLLIKDECFERRSLGKQGASR